MKILVIGAGGREHTLSWKLAQSARVSDGEALAIAEHGIAMAFTEALHFTH